MSEPGRPHGAGAMHDELYEGCVSGCVYCVCVILAVQCMVCAPVGHMPLSFRRVQELTIKQSYVSSDHITAWGAWASCAPDYTTQIKLRYRAPEAP